MSYTHLGKRIMTNRRFFSKMTNDFSLIMVVPF